jgi:hypothetical protein
MTHSVKKRQRVANLNNSNDGQPSDESSVAEKLSSFLVQLETLDQSTKSILDKISDPTIKCTLENLCALAKASSLMLQSFPPQIQSMQDEIATLPARMSNAISEEIRSRSVVISNLPESQAPNSTARARSDRSKIEILLDFFEMEEIPMTSFRMGKASAGRHRLLKVIFGHAGAAASFLRKRGKLSNGPFPNIQIRESLTKEALEARILIIEERIKRNAALSEDERNSDPWVFYAGVLQRKHEIPIRRH